MAVDKIQLLENDLDSINNGLQGLHERFNNFLLTDAFGQIDVEIDGATTFTTISIASPGLLGPIPNDSIFTVTHPDGSFAVTIRNEKATIPKGATSIVIYVDGNQPGDQVVDTYFGFPPGSLVSAPGYNQSDSTYAAGNNTDVQFNTNGRLDGDSSFTYDISTTKLTTPNIEVSGVIDGDIYASDGTSKVLENGTDGTDATFTGELTGNVTGNTTGNHFGDVYASNNVSRILDNGSNGGDATFKGDVIDVSNNTILDVSVPQLNASVVGGVTGNVTGNVSGSSGSCTGNAATATKIASITNSNIVQLTDTQTLTNKTLTDCEANTQAVGDNSTKIATTAFVIANAGTGGTPGGTGTGSFLSVQYNNNGSFGGDSSFQYSPSTGILSVSTIAATNIGGILATGTTLASSPAAGDDSLKVATTEWVLDNAGTGGTPAGNNLTIQYNDNGSFGGDNNFKIDPTNNILFANGKIDSDGKLQVGDFPTATTTYGALGNHSFAQGSNTIASGHYAVALNNTTTASALDSVAMGEHSIASGRQSLAGGWTCTASGAASVAFGALTIASGERAIAFGANNEVAAKDGVAMGQFHDVTTDSHRSLTLGFENTNHAPNTLLMGQENTINKTFVDGSSGAGVGSFVGGYGNQIMSNDGIIFGSLCNGNLATPGTDNSKNQFLFGLGLAIPKNNQGDAAGQSQTVVGKYNADQNQVHTLFAVGNGDSTTRSNAFNVDHLGRVGISNSAPSYTLDVVGDARKTLGGTAWSTTSDERVKKNIRPYEKGLSEITQIETKVFNYNGKGGTIDDSIDNVGVIAQEISKVFPNTVEAYNSKLDKNDDEETEILSFNPHELTYALINSVKELNAEVQALRKELNELKNK